jgi:hypothetical protein
MAPPRAAGRSCGRRCRRRGTRPGHAGDKVIADLGRLRRDQAPPARSRHPLSGRTGPGADRDAWITRVPPRPGVPFVGAHVLMMAAESDIHRYRGQTGRTSALLGTMVVPLTMVLLGLSEKTVRASAAAGVLAVAQRSPRLRLDVRTVHAVGHLISELRAAGQDRDLPDQVRRRLEDTALVDRDDLRESLDQMRRGKGRVLRPHASDETEGGR